jgi:hypothetical protein
MEPVMISLEKISNTYTVFEKDQMLTEVQLNSIAQYFEDQTRITRVMLLGVGLCFGLRPSLQENGITISRGFGITTDGDLILIKPDTFFDAYKTYIETNTKYSFFSINKNLIPLYELTEKKDSKSIPLKEFGSKTGKDIKEMAVFLYMESYSKDSDLCTSTDCDNLGKDQTYSIKPLLVEKSNVKLLYQNIQNPDQAFDILKTVTIARPVFNTSVTSLNLLGRQFRTACNAVRTSLLNELAKIYPYCSAFMSDIFNTNPYKAWENRLTSINIAFAKNNNGIQYYFDFLNDLTETYNRFRELLFDDTTWLNPETGYFPKHLLIGNLYPTADFDENRMPFYPSSLISKTKENIEHAKFLLQKLNILINTFQVPTAITTPEIRITPGKSAMFDLEERPIPIYYKLDEKNPVYKFWSYFLHKRNMDLYNYSYHANSYKALGGAASPLTSRINKFDFFRIEGHIGQNITTVHANIEKQIKDYNLPFALRAIFLGTNKPKLLIKPPIRYSDLHRLHYLLRQDVYHQLEEVKSFSGRFVEKINDAISSKEISDNLDISDGPAISKIAEEKNSNIKSSADSIKEKMKKPYDQFKTDNSSWGNQLGLAMKTGGEFKQSLGKIIKTDFNTPFDSLISNSHNQWIDWIDEIINKKDVKEDEKLIFPNFIKIHPGIDHMCGTNASGTFILIYDTSNNVVADFYLPYYCPETHEEQDNEPPLTKPAFRDNLIIKEGLFIQKSIEKRVKELGDTYQSKFDLQTTNYFNRVLDSYNTMSNVVVAKKNLATTSDFTNQDLGAMVDQVKYMKGFVDYYNAKAKEANLPTNLRNTYEAQAKAAQILLANTISLTTNHLANTNTDVSVGSEGFSALMELNSGLGSIKDETAISNVNETFGSIQTQLGKASPIGIIIGTMIRK